MIKFKLERNPVWIGMGRKEFDDSEFGKYPQEEREAIRFKILPVEAKRVREVMDKHMKDASIDMDTVDSIAKVIKKEFGGKGGEKKFAGALGAFKNEMVANRDIDWVGYMMEILDSIVLDWEGIVDVNDQVVECNKESKEIIFSIYPLLSKSLMEVSQKMLMEYEGYEMDQGKSAEKNLETTSDGLTKEEEI